VHRRALIGLVLTALLPAAAGGQTAGGVVRGNVRDPRGAPIRGAVVGVPGTTLYTFTDAGGHYRLAPVARGEIHLRVAAIGYAPATATVTLADSAGADFTLEPAPLELTPLDVVSTKVPQFGEPATSVAQLTEQEIARRRAHEPRSQEFLSEQRQVSRRGVQARGQGYGLWLRLGREDHEGTCGAEHQRRGFDRFRRRCVVPAVPEQSA